MMVKQFDEARIKEAAEHLRKKLNAYIEPGPDSILRDCPAYENGLTNSEREVAVIRALGLMVQEGTQRMVGLEIDDGEYEDYEAA